MDSLHFDLPDLPATERFAAELSAAIEPGLVVHLSGDLGAGKTTLVRAILRALGFSGAVKSPTYSLVELYNLSRLCFYHFDFYRLRAPEEFADAGLQEYFDGKAACFIEWPDKAGEFLPDADLRISIEIRGDGRELEIRARSERGRRCLTNLATQSTRNPTG